MAKQTVSIDSITYDDQLDTITISLAASTMPAPPANIAGTFYPIGSTLSITFALPVKVANLGFPKGITMTTTATGKVDYTLWEYVNGAWAQRGACDHMGVLLGKVDGNPPR